MSGAEQPTEQKKKSGVVAAVLNLVLPGAGYTYCGRWGLGIIAFLWTFMGVVTGGDIRFLLFCVALFVVDGFLCANRYNRVTFREKESADIAIWNPNATALWSVLFSPAFGSYLQMLNWNALGLQDRAVLSRKWFYATLSILGAELLVGLLSILIPIPYLNDSDVVDNGISAVALGTLFAWYFLSGRHQIRFVEEKYGNNYPRMPWQKPLLICFGATIGYSVIWFALIAFV